MHPNPPPSEPVGPGPKSQTKKSIQTQNHKSSQNNIFLASKRMPRSNKPICTKNPTNPRNFVNLEIKLANLKIPPTKHTRKKKNPHKFGSQKQNPNPNFAHKNTKRKKKKKKKPKPIQLWVCNEWGVVHDGLEFRDGGWACWRGAWCLIVAGLVSEDCLGRLREGLRGNWMLELRLRVETWNWVRLKHERVSWRDETWEATEEMRVCGEAIIILGL